MRKRFIAVSMLAACNMLKVDDDPAELSHQPEVVAALAEPTPCNSWPLISSARVLYYGFEEGKDRIEDMYLGRWVLDPCAEWTSRNDGTLDVGKYNTTSDGVKWNRYSPCAPGTELTVAPGSEKNVILTIDGLKYKMLYVSFGVTTGEINSPLLVGKRIEVRPTCTRTVIDMVNFLHFPTFHRNDFGAVIEADNRVTWLEVVMSSTCDEPARWTCRRSHANPMQ